MNRAYSVKVSSNSTQWRKGVVVIALAILLQAVILCMAVLIGVMDPRPVDQAKVRLSPGSPSETRAIRNQMKNQVAKLNRTQSDSSQQMLDSLVNSVQPDLEVASMDPSATIQAMGAMMPVGGVFSGSIKSFTDGIEINPLPHPDPVQLLGETLNAKRMVLLLDVSSSVKTKMERAGVSMNQLRLEVHRFIDQLGPNHLFGIIQFTRNWQPFNNELLPATRKVKQDATDWINRSFRTTGTSGHNWTRGYPNGIEGVLAAAFHMDAQIDEIFLVSDGDFQRTPPNGGGQNVPLSQLRSFTRSLQENTIGETRLRFLCFYPPEDALTGLRSWVHENGTGTLRVVN